MSAFIVHGGTVLRAWTWTVASWAGAGRSGPSGPASSCRRLGREVPRTRRWAERAVGSPGLTAERCSPWLAC